MVHFIQHHILLYNLMRAAYTQKVPRLVLYWLVQIAAKKTGLLCRIGHNTNGSEQTRFCSSPYQVNICPD